MVSSMCQLSSEFTLTSTNIHWQISQVRDARNPLQCLMHISASLPWTDIERFTYVPDKRVEELSACSSDYFITCLLRNEGQNNGSGGDGVGKGSRGFRGIVKARRAHTGLSKLLARGGVWEITKGKGKAVTAPPAWVWDSLATHSPSSAELACRAADTSSAARYFEVSPHRRK